MNEELNPLQRIVDDLDNPIKFIQPNISAAEAQYLLKALDYLAISSEEKPGLIENRYHDSLESKMIDIISYAPEDE